MSHVMKYIFEYDQILNSREFSRKARKNFHEKFTLLYSRDYALGTFWDGKKQTLIGRNFLYADFDSFRKPALFLNSSCFC